MKRKSARSLMLELKKLADPQRAQNLQRFFKTGPGQYGEGDRFFGIPVPMLRRIAKAYRELTKEEVALLLDQPWHEARLVALLILVDQFKGGDEATQRAIYRFYLEHTDRINNWDLVDLSAATIVGGWLYDRSRVPLYKLARSKSMWERRIAIIATFYFIRHDSLEETLAVARRLLADQEDLIHKATGWMLREVGKRDRQQLERFIEECYADMPRTTLRYAIERFPEKLRNYYLKCL